MPKMKVSQTVAKRFTVTKNGKILKRKAGQNHFNTRDRGLITRKKRRDVTMTDHYERAIKSLI